MKLSRIISLLAAIALLSLLAVTAGANRNDENFSVKEYGEFHRVLHPLQHEALPRKDFQRIRSNAGELVKYGEAIVKLGVPARTAEKYREDFRQELLKFKDALAKFSESAKNGTDEQLEASFGSVHDSFEMLAAMLPRK